MLSNTVLVLAQGLLVSTHVLVSALPVHALHTQAWQQSPGGRLSSVPAEVQLATSAYDATHASASVPLRLPPAPPADNNVLPSNVDIGVLIVICVFVAGFAWSWGPLGWLVSGGSGVQWRGEGGVGCSVRAVQASFHTRKNLSLAGQVPSEIQTLETRAAGMSVAVTVNL